MSLIGREMRYYTPFGPVIMRSTISDELHELLLRTANQLRDGTHPNKKINKKTNDYRGRLAGCLSEEYSYDKAFTPSEDKIIIEEMTWLASMFVEFAFKAGKIKKKSLRKPNELIMQRPVWVNYMKAGEWNPAHNHTGAISCVTYLQVPPEIEQENKTSEHTKKSNTPSAGCIEFSFGNVGMPYATGGFIRRPKRKDIYFFPAQLSHMVYPFKSEVERISVSVNFADKIDAEQNLKAIGQRFL